MCLLSKLKLPIQVHNNVTGKMSPFFDVLFINVKFNVTIFDVKILLMLSFMCYPIWSPWFHIRFYPPFSLIMLCYLNSTLLHLFHAIIIYNQKLMLKKFWRCFFFLFMPNYFNSTSFKRSIKIQIFGIIL